MSLSALASVRRLRGFTSESGCCFRQARGQPSDPFCGQSFASWATAEMLSIPTLGPHIPENGASPPRILVIDGDRVTLDQSSIDVDVAKFERLASRDSPRDLEQAAVLYVGDLLDGVDISEEPFEEWLRGERARLRETAVQVFTRLVPHQAK